MRMTAMMLIFPVQGGAGGWLPIGDLTNPFVRCL